MTLLLASPAAALSQPGSPPAPPVEAPAVQQAQSTFRSSTDLVTLNITVTDGQDKHLPGLHQGDFEVLEDGVRQDVTFFSATELPLDVALLIDSSSSMRDKLTLVQEAALHFLRYLKPGDRAQLIAFNSQARVMKPFTADLASVEEAVKKTVPRGGTALYMTLYVALDQFMRQAKAAAAGDVRRPAIIVLTDGEDTSSLVQFDDLLDRARRAGVPVYSISVVSPSVVQDVESRRGRRSISGSDFSMKTLAQETGGRAFFPLQLAELNSVYGSVASELSTQYALGYSPGTARQDGGFHRVTVRIAARPDARLRTRAGYYSPRAAASLAKPAETLVK